jgi:hypothetical protein
VTLFGSDEARRASLLQDGAVEERARPFRMGGLTCVAKLICRAEPAVCDVPEVDYAAAGVRL